VLKALIFALPKDITPLIAFEIIFKLDLNPTSASKKKIFNRSK
jgi:hypothetical protein